MLSPAFSILAKSLIHEAQIVSHLLLEKWTWLLFIFLLGQLSRSVKSYLVCRPRNALVSGLPTFVGQWLTSLSYHVIAVDIVRKGYVKGGGRLFAVPALDKYHVFVSSREQISEVANAPITQLSFNAAIDEQFLPHLVFTGFEFDPKDPRYVVPLHAMKVQLRDNLQALTPILQKRLEVVFQAAFPADKCTNRWLICSPHVTCQKMVETLNSIMLVGEELANDPQYLRAAMQYTRDVVITGEILRFTPPGLQTPIGWLAMNWSGGKSLVYKKVTSVMWGRINHPKEQSEKPRDFLQWMLDGTRKKSPQAVTKLAQHAMGLMFGGAHQLPMIISFALYNLCKYPEYLEPLREEAMAVKRNKDEVIDYDQMPLMDSFLKETARINPTTILTMPRKVLSPFTFADGTVISTDNWIVVPQQALMQDEIHYQDPSTFNGFRFVDSEGKMDPSARFSSASFNFTFWGGPKKPCPGRFYVAVVAKMILSDFILNYDLKLADPSTPRFMAWSYALVPHPMTRLLIRKRSLS